MSPQKQAAQIANAQKSHGAITEAGRARSSQNSIRHSLCSKKYYIAPEDRPEFDLYYNDLIDALAPEGALESVLAEKIILDEWRLTRARQVEDQIFCNGYMSAQNQFAAGAETWLAHSQELATLTLYEQRINRVLTRNKLEFESKQLTRRGAVLLDCDTSVPHPVEISTTQTNPAEPPQSTTEAAAPEQVVGFVHSSETAAAASQPSETVATEQPLGFVHSSTAASPAADNQSQTPVTEVPETAVTEESVGFVRSTALLAVAEEPAAHPAESIAAPQPASTPPAAVRRAA
jgi:hypothetical protein